jgi:hypothetical protein
MAGGRNREEVLESWKEGAGAEFPETGTCSMGEL